MKNNHLKNKPPQVHQLPNHIDSLAPTDYQAHITTTNVKSPFLFFPFFLKKEKKRTYNPTPRKFTKIKVNEKVGNSPQTVRAWLAPSQGKKKRTPIMSLVRRQLVEQSGGLRRHEKT